MRYDHKKAASMLLWIMVITLAACTKDTHQPEDPTISRLMIYNASPAYYGRSAGFVLADKVSFSDTVHAQYNCLASLDSVGVPVGALQAAHYFVQAPGDYRCYYLDSNGVLNAGREIRLLQNQRATIYMADSLGYMSMLVTQDDTERPSGKAKIRLINLSPDAGSIQLSIDTTVVAGLTSLRYREASGYVEVATTTNSGIKVTTADDLNTTLSRKSFPLNAGYCYTLVLRGYVNPPIVEGDDPLIRQNQTISLSAIINQ